MQINQNLSCIAHIIQREAAPLTSWPGGCLEVNAELFLFLIEESYCLSAGDRQIRGELIASGAAGNVIGYSPGNRICIVDIGGSITKAVSGSGGGTGRTPLEGDGLSAGNRVVRTEGGGAGAAGNAIGHSPQHRVIVVVAGAHIDKGIAAGDLGGAVGSPQEGHHLGPGHRVIGAEGGDTGAAGHAVFYSPQYRFVIIVAGGNVSEGLALFLRHLVAGNDSEGGQDADVLHGDGIAAHEFRRGILLGTSG